MTSLELHRQAAALPTWPDLLREFSAKFGHHLGERPGVPPVEVAELRGKLIAEESVELLEAIDSGDVAAVAKEACDLLYVTIGTMLAYGIDPVPIFVAVHAANMTKSQEKREDTKTLKGNGYLPPNVSGLLRLQGWPGPAGGKEG
jgi:predicted HAD superfamily Cof-like phosphohydrolase